MVAKIEESLAVIQYDVTEAAIAELASKYAGLKIVDPASYEHVRVALGDVRTKRIGVEKRRKELKADALEYGRKVDARAKELTESLLAIENPLQDEKDKADVEKEKARQEKARKEKERVDGIRAKITGISLALIDTQGKTSTEIENMIRVLSARMVTEEEFQEFQVEALKTQAESLGALNRAKENRVKWEQEEAKRKEEVERLDKIRKEQETERKRLAEARKAEEEKSRREREALEVERRKIEAEKKALEDAKKAEQDRKNQEALERQLAENARIKAEADAKAKVEREAKEAEEKAQREAEEKARREKLRPDKEKLLAFADVLVSLKAPHMDSEKGQTILSDAAKSVRRIAAMIRKNAEEM